MIQFNKTAGAALAIALLTVTPALAKNVSISGSFGPENGDNATGTGQVSGSFDTVTDKVTYTITYSGLSGPVKAAHFHGPAGAGQEAPVLLPIPGPYATDMHGTLTANAATAKALLAGKTYVNLHTAKYPMGEIRAQIQAGS